MAHPHRIYGKGEKPAGVFDPLSSSNRYFYLRVGRIIDINYDKYTMLIEWITGTGSPDWIPITFPYVGPAGCIGSMPEIGSLGIFGFYQEGPDSIKGSPLLLCYLPGSFQAALDYNWTKVLPDSIPTEEDNYFFLKFRKLHRGDLVMASLHGGEIFVNRDVEIQDGMQDTILLRQSDRSIIATSVNQFNFTNSTSVHAGPIIRNMVNIFDSVGVRIANQLAREYPLPDGREVVYLVPGGAEIDESTQFYSEYRIDVDDLAGGTLDHNDINSSTTMSLKDPIVTMIMGNYAGASSFGKRYGRILRPVLFSSSEDLKGHFDFVQCNQNRGVDEVGLLGVAFGVHLLKKDAFMGFDKEGAFYLNMASSSTANPTGAGRSMSLLGQGALKEVWGATADDGNSWNLSTTGGVRWNIGMHTGKAKSRSIDIRTASGIKLEVRNNDDDGFARQEYIYGNQMTSIGGLDTKTVSGGSLLTVTGLKTEAVWGSSTLDVHNDYTISVAGQFTISASSEMQGKYKKRKETVSEGQELEITKGDDKETIKIIGNKKTSLTKGDIEETIIAGNRKTTITTGKYTISVTQGDIEITSSTGNVKIDATQKITIQGQIQVDVKGTKVNLGMGPTGGVVTGQAGTPSHMDYITGAPLKGASTVMAGA